MQKSSSIDNDLLDVEYVEEDTQKDKFLTFRLGEEEYGLEIRNVIEIIGIQRVTDLPDTPKYVRGVINLRGKVVPVIDVRLRFGMAEKEYNERTCIVVVNLNEMLVGLIVDSVSEVIDIPAGDIETPPTMKKSAKNHFLSGLGKVGDTVKILLDLDQLVQGEDIEQILEVANV
ncbi:chemotaxis protein CheW [bacterium]|nr:chemotaxis protein CheW [bacterium]